ncbi:39S mitochondrial ribosomal protein L46-domain-containing protein [Roridomyces roridus]|uniref:Large ribosomal subunit protein mL46 n=1 Tax=Roridomyces roridus TaxID=1738132 RepID=A0AAD7BW20_9AGAR|nr:39S mitochondrial ribosomal protein L46-domain-containing protein [Roridomyces roridus]
MASISRLPCTTRRVPAARSLATVAKPSKPVLSTAVILNRAPILTPSPTVFERAFYAYQQRIRRALHNPFPSEFYFKQGSLLEARFNSEERYRERVAWGPGYVKEEVMSEERKAAEKAAIDQMALQDRSDDKLLPRVHPSDRVRDYQSLDRKGRRNLYLLIRDTGHKTPWEFPRGLAAQDELLHQSAQREFLAKCGNYMDTWIVTRKPIGMFKPRVPEQAPEKITFFFKAHIMAGQVRPADSMKDFMWLTKQEIQTRVTKEYWEGVKDMLSDH